MSSSNTRSACLVCGELGEVKYPARIDPDRYTSFTYSSRKTPELMHFEYKICNSCSILYVSDAPNSDDLIENYIDAAFDAKTESKCAAETYWKEIKALRIESLDQILDVGCGDGEFLGLCASHGFPDVLGIEPSPAAAETSPSDIRQRIFLGGYQDFESDHKFDLITLFQTIEHLPDPNEFMLFCSSFLKNNGNLVVVCHDFTGWINRILGKKSPIFDVEHLQIFSKRSVSLLFEKHGFDVYKVRTIINRYPLSYVIRLSPLPDRIKDMRLWRSRLGRFTLPLPLGNIMIVGKLRSCG